jgi:hypothetical protein
MAKEGRLGEAESRVLRDAALEMYALADLQLAREDLQSQVGPPRFDNRQGRQAQRRDSRG